jgi:hypothetical protein
VEGLCKPVYSVGEWLKALAWLAASALKMEDYFFFVCLFGFFFFFLSEHSLTKINRTVLAFAYVVMSPLNGLDKVSGTWEAYIRRTRVQR